MLLMIANQPLAYSTTRFQASRHNPIKSCSFPPAYALPWMQLRKFTIRILLFPYIQKDVPLPSCVVCSLKNTISIHRSGVKKYWSYVGSELCTYP
jgi:hypothetical protein